MLHELQQAGLSEKSAKVYLASLDLGSATADQLAKQANVNRSTTYVQIQSLMKLGLMSTYEEGKRTFFAPESPEALKRVLSQEEHLLQAKERELEEALPELQQLFTGAGERPVVRFFTGKEGVVALRNEMLNVKEKITHAIYNANLLEGVFTPAEMEEYVGKRDSAGIHSKAIYTRKEGRFAGSPSLRTEQVYVPPHELALEVDIVIYDDKVVILSPTGSIFGVLLQSEKLADSMKSLFSLLWGKYKDEVRTASSEKK